MAAYLQVGPDLDDPAVAGIFDELSFWAARFGALLFDHLALRDARRILDVGCANGFPLFELAHVAGATAQVTGIDIWQAPLARARFKRQVYGRPDVGIVAADAARLPFPGATFDLIVSNLGINNFADPAAVLAECARVARPAGRIALTTNLAGHMHEFYAVFRAIVAATGNPAYLPRLAANEAHRGTPESVQALLAAAGFRVTRVVADRFQMRYRDGGALLNHALTRFGFLPGWRGVVDPADEAAVFARLEQRLDALAAAQGELRMTVPMLYVEGEKAANPEGDTPSKS